MAREEELKLTAVTPILDVVFLRRIATSLEKVVKQLEELTRIGVKLDSVTRRLEELNKLIAPPLHRFPANQRYQYKLVKAGESDIVFKLDIPPDKVGVITEVANSWYPNTYYMWSVDGAGRAERVERQIAPIESPKQYDKGIVAFVGIEWEAYNNDTRDHVFEVLVDGYFIDKALYRRIVGI
ncbi:MAG: hypothetical protein QXG12_06700 [Thermoproteota archaeon]